MYSSRELRYKRDDDYGEEEEEDRGGGWGCSWWLFMGGGLLVLILLATLGVSSATLGIVNEHKSSWKGVGGGSFDSEEIEHAFRELQKHFDGLDDKVDWVKKDLGELDEIQKELWWIHERLTRGKSSHSSSTSPHHHSSDSSSSSDSHDYRPTHHSSDTDDKKPVRKDVCPVQKGEALRFCDPYTGVQGIFNPETQCPYFYFSLPPFVADDGAIAQDFKRGYVKVDSLPFTLTVPQGPLGVLDHVKWLVFGTIPIAVSEWQTVRRTVKMACETDTGNQPFPADLVTNPGKDIRLASCAANSIDLNTLMVFDFIMTGPKDGSEGVKSCFYERLPLTQNCTDPNQPECYRAFSSYQEIGPRYKDDVEELTLEYDREQNEVRWYDKGKLVCQVTDLGTPSEDFLIILDHGGNNKIVDMEQLSFGGGTFTLLDMTNPQDPASQTGLVKLTDTPGYYVKPCDTCFYDVNSEESNRLFGQGAKMLLLHNQVTVQG